MFAIDWFSRVFLCGRQIFGKLGGCRLRLVEDSRMLLLNCGVVWLCLNDVSRYVLRNSIRS